jgi:hypothetical protein
MSSAAAHASDVVDLRAVDEDDIIVVIVIPFGSDRDLRRFDRVGQVRPGA